ncbi:MAG TPA: Rrf2 family transcriptional regulator [Bacteroidales bacterium]|nr:Rrf2 family transcriptional regulator [Bacteroidales bacterium]HQH18748.1 Rrf2 family transcriptional regulator [Bacteroidales bacterium]HQI46123.1 Rrf2 family transcriptional regulator [Bacteroidales bacterium]
MSRIVQLSEAVSIGLHSMVVIARSKELINVNKISALTGASRNHLAKIMQRLVKANFLFSNRGPSGGFLLKRKPEDITIMSIYEAIEGPIEQSGCPMDQKVCPFDKCLMGGIVKKAEDELINYFKKQTLKDFI